MSEGHQPDCRFREDGKLGYDRRGQVKNINLRPTKEPHFALSGNCLSSLPLLLDRSVALVDMFLCTLIALVCLHHAGPTCATCRILAHLAMAFLLVRPVASHSRWCRFSSFSNTAFSCAQTAFSWSVIFF